MSKARAKELIDFGDRMFSDKGNLDSLNQEIAENVYPTRACFTREINIGDNYADDQMDSYPSLARRELGNAMSAVQRPKGRPCRLPGRIGFPAVALSVGFRRFLTGRKGSEV